MKQRKWLVSIVNALATIPAKKLTLREEIVRHHWTVLSLVLLCSPAVAQEPRPANPGPVTGLVASVEPASVLTEDQPTKGRRTRNQGFEDFIGFMSDPSQNIDPRAVSEIYPLFASFWTKEAGPVPASGFQLYGAGLTVALSDRLAIGLNQGGYADVHLSKTDAHMLAVVDQIGRAQVLDLVRRNPAALLALFRQHGLDVRELLRLQRLVSFDPTLQFSDVEAGGHRSGFLNFGGFIQYTLIQDPDRQFLLTTGMRLEAPCGSYEIFEGHGPVHLAPYVTVGKGWGDFHVLATAGYYFPVGPGDDSIHTFYADVHLDRRLLGWLYPLVEFNFDYWTRGVDLDLAARKGFFNFRNFEATGNILTMAVGANAVLRPQKLEIGAVYQTTIATQHDFNMNGLVVKLVYRF